MEAGGEYGCIDHRLLTIVIPVKAPIAVIAAKAGIQYYKTALDASLRWHDNFIAYFAK